MHEQLSLGGRPIVGFGEEGDWSFAHPPRSEKVIMSVLAGVSAGAILGNLFKHGFIGAVVGGSVAGTIMAVATSPTDVPKTPSTPAAPSPWQRMQPSDMAGLKVGQQYAMAAVAPNGAPIPPEEIAQLNVQLTALATAPVNLPMGHFATYPPGTPLPADWPSDDDLGPNAYRMTADMITDMPNIPPLKIPDPSVGTFKLWVRTKP